jgi:putative phosphoribosyl transferase
MLQSEGIKMALYRDRYDAGQVLAGKLAEYANRPAVLVLALPRGGVPVGYEVASALHVPLDVFIVRKLGVPGHEELAMGAIASGGTRILNTEVVDVLQIPQQVLDAVTEHEWEELTHREHLYRDDRPAPHVAAHTVILVDDGLATGATMRAAATALRQQRPARLVVAVPVAAQSTCDEFRREVDEIVCAATPEPFYAVGFWYEDFSPTSDQEVRDLLAAANTSFGGAGPRQLSTRRQVNMDREQYGAERPAQVRVGAATLDGDLVIPAQAKGVVLFAHGSGSSRHSPRNRYVAQRLNEAGLATLLLDLLTAEEEQVDIETAQLRFDIGLLAERLLGATDWLMQNPDTGNLRIGYFGASTGAGAALVAAAQRPAAIGAVVSRGGRPDLARDFLPQVQAPTLLIVGGNDEPVITLNRQALAMLHSEKRIEIVPAATHLFEEPGKLEVVAQLARDWFARYLGAGNPPLTSSAQPALEQQ